MDTSSVITPIFNYRAAIEVSVLESEAGKWEIESIPQGIYQLSAVISPEEKENIVILENTYSVCYLRMLIKTEWSFHETYNTYQEIKNETALQFQR